MVESEIEPVVQSVVDGHQAARRRIAASHGVGDALHESPEHDGDDPHPGVSAKCAKRPELGEGSRRHHYSRFLGQLPGRRLGEALHFLDEPTREGEHALEGLVAAFHESHHRPLVAHREDGDVDGDGYSGELGWGCGHGPTLGPVVSPRIRSECPYSARRAV